MTHSYRDLARWSKDGGFEDALNIIMAQVSWSALPLDEARSLLFSISGDEHLSSIQSLKLSRFLAQPSPAAFTPKRPLASRLEHVKATALAPDKRRDLHTRWRRCANALLGELR